MAINSRNKGKRGEVELSHLLNSYGFKTRRSQQYCGANGDADVVNLPYVHIECKRVQALNLSKAMEQSRNDATAYTKRTGEPVFPTVMHRKNHERWMVTMSLEDWMNLYKSFAEGRKDNDTD